MSEIPGDLSFTRDHEWVRAEGSLWRCGITDHAQESLGDVTFVDLPKVGATFAAGAVFGVVESVKAASDLFMPFAGEIVEVNTSLPDAPEKINDSPYGEGWMIVIKATGDIPAAGLLDAAAYAGEIG